MTEYSQPNDFEFSNVKQVNIIAAGGIIFRRESSNILIVIVEREETGKWAPMRRQIPKGECEEGESLEQTAVREVQEETGFRVGIVGKAGEAKWSFIRNGIEHKKTTHYFLMKPISLEQGEHDSEYQYVRWIKMVDAASILSYPEERQLIKGLLDDFGEYN